MRISKLMTTIWLNEQQQPQSVSAMITVNKQAHKQPGTKEFKSPEYTKWLYRHHQMWNDYTSSQVRMAERSDRFRLEYAVLNRSDFEPQIEFPITVAVLYQTTESVKASTKSQDETKVYNDWSIAMVWVLTHEAIYETAEIPQPKVSKNDRMYLSIDFKTARKHTIEFNSEWYDPWQQREQQQRIKAFEILEMMERNDPKLAKLVEQDPDAERQLIEVYNQYAADYWPDRDIESLQTTTTEQVMDTAAKNLDKDNEELVKRQQMIRNLTRTGTTL